MTQPVVIIHFILKNLKRFVRYPPLSLPLFMRQPEPKLPQEILEIIDNQSFFNPRSYARISEGGNLPHWHQQGKIQFVTFRLADSLPQSRIGFLKDEIERFTAANPKPWDGKTLERYRELIGPIEEKLLHQGYGLCPLKNVEIREILIEALHFRDGQDYRLLAYVIMPNHVHLLLLPLEDNSLTDILHSVKLYSSRRVNRNLQTSGPLWMRESFDRLVRNSNELIRYIDYIRTNPRHLPPSDYTLYVLGSK